MKSELTFAHILLGSVMAAAFMISAAHAEERNAYGNGAPLPRGDLDA